MRKCFARITAVLVASVVAAFRQVFFSARPPLMTDPAKLAGDGSTLDDCDHPALAGIGKGLEPKMEIDGEPVFLSNSALKW